MPYTCSRHILWTGTWHAMVLRNGLGNKRLWNQHFRLPENVILNKQWKVLLSHLYNLLHTQTFALHYYLFSVGEQEEKEHVLIEAYFKKK